MRKATTTWKRSGLLAAILAGGALLFAPTLSATTEGPVLEDAEIEGPVSNLTGSCPDLSFTVAGTTVLTQGGIDWDDGTCADVREGTVLEVEGYWEGKNLRAAEVNFE